MTPVLTAVYEGLLEIAGRSPYAGKSRVLVRRFLETTGKFDAEHPCSQVRLTAAWEDALCRGGLALDMIGCLDEAERGLGLLITRAHRGVFRFEVSRGARLAHDLWSGASFLLVGRDDVGREMRGDSLGALCQGRVVGAADGCALLPGVVFHAPEATASIESVLQHAAERNLDTNRVCDALLRMDHALQTLSRVKPAYAYRAEMLVMEHGPAGN